MTPEFSRPQAVAAIGPDGLAATIEANATERAALAKRFDVPRLDDLRAELNLTQQREGLAITGAVAAHGAQRCRVSGQLVDFVLAEPVKCLYVADPEAMVDQLDPEDDIDLDQLSDTIDLGEMVAQIFALGLDPYPRRADLPAEPVSQAAGPPTSPFAVLSRLKNADGKDRA
ncbi:MAG: DUF177 domain-containing protein [Sphingomonadales bacterium]